jgi:hypothetical protein
MKYLNLDDINELRKTKIIILVNHGWSSGRSQNVKERI